MPDLQAVEWAQRLRAAMQDHMPIYPILPIPSPPRISVRSHRGRSRIRQAMRVWECAEEIRLALNGLFGARDADGVGDSSGPHKRIVHSDDSLRSNVHFHVWVRLLRFGQRLDVVRRGIPTGARWAKALERGSQELYLGNQAVVDKYTPIMADMIAEPPAGASSVQLLDLLPPDMAKLYSKHGELGAAG